MVYVLRDWIDPKKVDWLYCCGYIEAVDEILNYPEERVHSVSISKNPDAVEYLIENPEKINWAMFSTNTSPLAMEFLTQQHPDGIDWFHLSSNSCQVAVDFMKKNTEHVFWLQVCYNKNPEAIRLFEEHMGQNLNRMYGEILSFNPTHEAIQLLEKNPHIIYLGYLASNPSDEAILLFEKLLSHCDMKDMLEHNTVEYHLSRNPSAAAIRYLKKNPDLISWCNLCENDSDHAMELLFENPDKINGMYLSRNSHPRAIEWLEQHPNEIDWYYLMTNEGAVDLIEKYQDKINWCVFPQNRGIFIKKHSFKRPEE